MSPKVYKNNGKKIKVLHVRKNGISGILPKRKCSETYDSPYGSPCVASKCNQALSRASFGLELEN